MGPTRVYPSAKGVKMIAVVASGACCQRLSRISLLIFFKVDCTVFCNASFEFTSFHDDNANPEAPCAKAASLQACKRDATRFGGKLSGNEVGNIGMAQKRPARRAISTACGLPVTMSFSALPGHNAGTDTSTFAGNARSEA